MAMLLNVIIIEDKETQDFVERLYLDYAIIMWKYAYKILHDSQLADDTVHIAFENIINKSDLLTSLNIQKVKAYIMIMTRNTAYTISNKQKRINALDFDEIAYTQSDTYYSIEEIVADKAQFEILKKAMETIPLSYRDVITMKYQYDYDNKEIAEILGVKADSVRVILHRALNALKKQLIEKGE